MTNEQFATHTRSATFALTLSDPQIRYLLAADKVVELRAKYPWYDGGGSINFGTDHEAAILETNSTVRALVRKGLVTVQARPLPCHRTDIVQPTQAGRLIISLLAEAGFEANPLDVPSVPLHPDDRGRIWFDDQLQCRHAPAPGDDRRDPADQPFLSSLIRKPVVVS